MFSKRLAESSDETRQSLSVIIERLIIAISDRNPTPVAPCHLSQSYPTARRPKWHDKSGIRHVAGPTFHVLEVVALSISDTRTRAECVA